MKRSRTLLTLVVMSLLVGCNPTPSSSETSSETSVTSAISIPSEASEISSEPHSEIASELSEISSEILPSTESSMPKELTTVFYQNPVYDADFPDPSVIRHTDGTFYAYATGTRVIKSVDLVNWERLSNALSNPGWGTPGSGTWAPDVQYIDGQYVMYYSRSVWDDPNPGIGVATAPHPEGPWTDHGKLFNSVEIGVNNSIDPMVFQDDDGRVYMFWGSFRGIYAIELTADGLDFKDGSVEAAALNKEHVAGYPTTHNFDISSYEGVYLIKKGDFYYMFLSTGQCCSGDYTYNVRVGRATSVLGPYTDHLDRSMQQGAVGYRVVDQNAHFIGVGHNSIIQDDAGTYFIAYHGYDASSEVRNARRMLIDKLNWDQDGWPSTLGAAPSNNRRPGPEIYL